MYYHLKLPLAQTLIYNHATFDSVSGVRENKFIYTFVQQTGQLLDTFINN